MRRWQLIAATVAAGATGVVTFQHGYSFFITLVLAASTFILLRWAFTWQGRVRYYLRYGNHHDQAYCPNCKTSRHRRAGDWILKCKRCGWTAGWPGVRLLTRSVAMNQLRRTVSAPVLLILLIIIGGVLSGGVVGVAPAIQDVNNDVRAAVNGSMSGEAQSSPEGDTTTATIPQTRTTTATPTTTGSEGYDFTKVETIFINLLNEERRDRGLDPVTQRDELTAMGTAHAENMARHDYLGHVEPDGTTIQDRYESRGLLPECRLQIQDSDRYYPGAENAYQGWIDRRIEQSDGTLIDVTNETDLARAMFESWMDSEPHREAMLVASADQAGLGIAKVDDSEKVYAALELC